MNPGPTLYTRWNSARLRMCSCGRKRMAFGYQPVLRLPAVERATATLAWRNGANASGLPPKLLRRRTATRDQGQNAIRC